MLLQRTVADRKPCVTVIIPKTRDTASTGDYTVCRCRRRRRLRRRRCRCRRCRCEGTLDVFFCRECGNIPQFRSSLFLDSHQFINSSVTVTLQIFKRSLFSLSHVCSNFNKIPWVKPGTWSNIRTTETPCSPTVVLRAIPARPIYSICHDVTLNLIQY